MYSPLQARHAKVTPFLRELFVVVHRLLHRLGDTQPVPHYNETHDVSHARIVVEDSETEHEMSVPSLSQLGSTSCASLRRSMSIFIAYALQRPWSRSL